MTANQHITLSTLLHLERNRKPHGILHNFLNRFSNTRDRRALIWAGEPNPVREQQNHLNGKILGLKGTVKLQQRDLEHFRLKHLHHSILGLSFLPLSQWTVIVETAPPAPKRSHVLVRRWSFAYPNTAELYRLGIVPNANPNNAAGETAATQQVGRDIKALISVETRLLVSF